MCEYAIGILTFHNTTNYGATLQTYALQTYLGQIGLKSVVIDYRSEKASRVYFRSLFLNLKPYQGFIKYKLFKSFRKKHLLISSKVSRNSEDLFKNIVEYTHLICGSDEIWNLQSFRGYDRAFFFEGFKRREHKLISYAASLGQSASFGENKMLVAGALQSFNALSVRDKNTQRVVEAECGISPSLVLDPTFLIDFSEFFNLKEAPLKEKYLLVYGVLSKDEQKYVAEYARNKNLRIVSVGYDNKLFNLNLVGIGVEEWLRFFYHADTVVSTFYHGVIFSLKFNKNVIVFSRKHKSNKIKSLTDMLDVNAEKLILSDESNHSDLEGLTYSRGKDYQNTFDKAYEVSVDYIKSSIYGPSFRFKNESHQLGS